MDPETFLEGHPTAIAVYVKVGAELDAMGDVEIATSKSQIAFRRRRGFAYLWLPGRYLKNPGAEVVLSIALPRHDRSPRFKEVVHPTERQWMHHLELHDADEVDGEVIGWLGEAWDHAG